MASKSVTSSRLLCALHVALLLIILSNYCTEARNLGGLDDEREADNTVRDVVNSVKKDLESLTSTNFKRIEPISYRRQMVAGYNYFVKVTAFLEDESERNFHLRIYKPFRGKNELMAYRELSKPEFKKLEYFE